MNIGDRLREFRKLHDMTQKDLEKLSGVPQSTISKIECGHDDVSVLAMVRLADVLQLDMDELLGREEYIKGGPAIAVELRQIAPDFERAPENIRRVAAAAARTVIRSFSVTDEPCAIPA